MRGGAIPLLAWATLLVILMGEQLDLDRRRHPGGDLRVGRRVGVRACRVAGRAGTGEALEDGAAAARLRARGGPGGELRRVLVGLSIACIVFGLVWAGFLIYFGAGVLALSLGRLVLELRAELAAHDALEARDAIEEPRR